MGAPQTKWTVALLLILIPAGTFTGCRKDRGSIERVQELAYSVKPAVVRVRAFATARFIYTGRQIRAASDELRRLGLPGAKNMLSGERNTETGTGGSGSGFIIHPDGFILTSGHVIEATRSPDSVRQELLRNGAIAALVQHFSLDVLRTLYRNEALEPVIAILSKGGRIEELKIVNEVELSNGTIAGFQVKAYSPSLLRKGTDLAVLKINRSSLPILRLGSSDRVHVGDAVWSVGYPAVASSTDDVIGGWLSSDSDLEATFNNGTITSIKRDVTKTPVLQTNLAIYRGNSGGPAVDREGQVIGIATWGHAAADQIKFLVPIDIARELLDRSRIVYNVESPFNVQLRRALDSAGAGEWEDAKVATLAASAMFPNSPDLIRFRTDVDRAMRADRGWQSSNGMFAAASIGVAVLLVAGSLLFLYKSSLPLAAPAPAGTGVETKAETKAETMVEPESGSFPRKGSESILGRFTILNGERAGEKLGLGGSGIRIGRESSVCEIVLQNPKISRLHAEVVKLDGRVLLIDRNSSNGTFVNDRKIDRHYLVDGDIIYFGGRSAVAVAFHV